MLTLEQFTHVKNNKRYFRDLLPIAQAAYDAAKAKETFSFSLDVLRKLAKRERDYNMVGFDSYTAKEFIALQKEYIKQLGNKPVLQDIEKYFNDDIKDKSKLEESAEKFIFLEK